MVEAAAEASVVDGNPSAARYAFYQEGYSMGKLIKNIEYSKVLPLSEQVEYLKGQIVSKTLAQNDNHSLTLFAFDKGEEISTHESSGDAFVLALDGAARISIAGEKYSLRTGEAIVMPANVPHSVYAEEQFKMLLTVFFAKNE